MAASAAVDESADGGADCRGRIVRPGFGRVDSGRGGPSHDDRPAVWSPPAGLSGTTRGCCGSGAEFSQPEEAGPGDPAERLWRIRAPAGEAVRSRRSRGRAARVAEDALARGRRAGMADAGARISCGKSSSCAARRRGRSDASCGGRACRGLRLRTVRLAEGCSAGGCRRLRGNARALKNKSKARRPCCSSSASYPTAFVVESRGVSSQLRRLQAISCAEGLPPKT